MSSSYNTPWIKHKLVVSIYTRTLKQVSRCPPLLYGAALSSLAISGLAFFQSPPLSIAAENCWIYKPANQSINQIRIINVAKISGVITKSTETCVVDIWIVTEKCLEMVGGTGMSLVCGRNPSRRRMIEYQEAGCSRGMDAATGNERRPTVARQRHYIRQPPEEYK